MVRLEVFCCIVSVGTCAACVCCVRTQEPLRMTIRTLVFALTPNIPTAGTKTGQITIVGYEFKETNLTPSMLIGSTICRSLSWTAKTAMKCWADAGYGTSLKATITISDGVPCSLLPSVASRERSSFVLCSISIDRRARQVLYNLRQPFGDVPLPRSGATGWGRCTGLGA